MSKEEKQTHTKTLTREMEELQAAIVAYIKASPSFPNDTAMAENIGRCLANVESTLHWHFDCWELGLPHKGELK